MSKCFSLNDLEDALFILNGEGAILDEELNWMISAVRDAQIEVEYARRVRLAILSDEDLFNTVMERCREVDKHSKNKGELTALEVAVNRHHEWFQEHCDQMHISLEDLLGASGS